MKQCTKCGEMKELEEFPLAKLGRDGRAAECKACHNQRYDRKNRPLERSEANRQGHSRYFTGRPCINGHIAERNKHGNCIECLKLQKEKHTEDPERKRQRRKRWYEENAEHCRDYRARNRNRNSFLYNTRRAGPACPKWVDLKAIESFYLACPPGMIVDHRIAFRGLVGKYPVSGLHVLWNLQYISPLENMRKNRYVRD